MNAKSFIIASAAAALFIAGGAGMAGAEEGDDAKIKCDGANSCKGQSACKTDSSACAGHNECKGKGFVMLSEADCEAAKADE
jgi:hypothetical protein